MNLYPWQQHIFNRITSGGFKHKEIVCMTSSRMVGKSTLNQVIFDAVFDKGFYKLIQTPEESGTNFYKIFCSKPVEEWIKTQEKNSWVDITDKTALGSFFEVSESIYIMLKLKFPDHVPY
jgi:hypothetical protein